MSPIKIFFKRALDQTRAAVRMGTASSWIRYKTQGTFEKSKSRQPTQNNDRSRNRQNFKNDKELAQKKF